MSQKLQGKVAIVTGGASGIGAAVALEFVRNGAKVVLADINEELLLSTCEDIKQKTGGEAVTVVADVSKEEDNKRIVETAVSTFGGLHVSFLNAGRHVPVSIVDFTEEQFDTLFGVNVKGVAFGLKHQLSAMSKTGDKGSVIITSSIVATKTFAKCDLYGSSKAAAAMLVKYGAVEGAAMNVRVNGIAPGLVRSGITKSLGEEKMQQTSRDMHLTKKVIATEQVAPLVVFLASDDAAVITGSIHPIDAGAAAVF